MFLKYAENSYCAKHWQLSVNKPERVASNHPFSTTISGSGQSSFDPNRLSSDDDEDLTSQNVAEMTSGHSDRAAHLWAAARLDLNSPTETPQNWGQHDPNRNDYHSDLIVIISSFWLPNITNWWHQQEETRSKYADLSNVARNRFSIIPHGVGVEASFSLGRDISRWRQSKTTGEAFHKNVVLRQYARANNGILAGDDPVYDTN